MGEKYSAVLELNKQEFHLAIRALVVGGQLVEVTEARWNEVVAVLRAMPARDLSAEIAVEEEDTGELLIKDCMK